MSGVINWFITCAKTIANQKGHLLSDVATSAGIPGPIMSTLKEISALPCFKDTMFSENLRKAYQNGIGTEKKQLDLGPFNKLFEGASSKVDMRTEKAIAHELKRQAIPVIINEALVRGFYFVRRFIAQMKDKKSISELDWKAVLPFQNRTIARMLTISTGVFTAFDIIDAAIRSRGFNANCLLRINFVGVGRFIVAVGNDVVMGVKKSKAESQRMKLCEEKMLYTNAKVFCYQAGMWVAAENAVQAILRTRAVLEDVMEEFKAYHNEMLATSQERRDSIDKIRKADADFAQELSDILLWGSNGDDDL